MKGNDVYICYSTKDYRYARQFIEEFEKAGIGYIEDRNLCSHITELDSQVFLTSKLFLFIASVNSVSQLVALDKLKYAAKHPSIKVLYYSVDRTPRPLVLESYYDQILWYTIDKTPINLNLIIHISQLMGKEQPKDITTINRNSKNHTTDLSTTVDYDVFISCKSTDYPIGEKVYNYLVSKGFYVFLSCKELEKIGEAEYLDAISDALNTSEHLILVSTSKANVISKWVKFEWQTFLNEILSGRKQGKIVTVLDKMSVGDLPIQLRSYESFTLSDYKDRILKYIETDSYLSRLDEQSKKAEEEKQKRRHKLLSEINSKEEEYLQEEANLNAISTEIISLRKELGITTKTCPLCNSIIPLESKFCPECGWTLSPLHKIELSIPREQVLSMRKFRNRAAHGLIDNDSFDQHNIEWIINSASSIERNTQDNNQSKSSNDPYADWK